MTFHPGPIGSQDLDGASGPADEDDRLAKGLMAALMVRAIERLTPLAEGPPAAERDDVQDDVRNEVSLSRSDPGRTGRGSRCLRFVMKSVSQLRRRMESEMERMYPIVEPWIQTDSYLSRSQFGEKAGT